MAERIPNFSAPASLNHVAIRTMWYMLCTSEDDLEQCDTALKLKLTLKLDVLWLQGWGRGPQTILPALTLWACIWTELAQASCLSFLISAKKPIYAVLSLPDRNADASVSEHCQVQACCRISPYYFPRLICEFCGLQKMFSKFLCPQEEEEPFLLSCHNPLSYFF